MIIYSFYFYYLFFFYFFLHFLFHIFFSFFNFNFEDPGHCTLTGTIIDPKLWTAETPHLYILVISLHHDLSSAEKGEGAVDVETCRVGIRDIQIAGKCSTYCTELYCTVLYCTVLYCTVLYCTVLYCTVLYCTVLTIDFLCDFALYFHIIIKCYIINSTILI